MRDEQKIANAFREMFNQAMVINEVLGRNEHLNTTVPTNWPLNLSADEWAAECMGMVEHYEDLCGPTPIGTRVKLVEDVENYPTIYLKAGETGTLTEIDGEGSYWVKLDQHHDELNEWENQIQIWDHSDLNEGKYHPESFIERIAS